MMMNLRILLEFSIFFHCVCTVFPPNLRHPTSKLLKMEKSPTEAVVFTSSCVRKNRCGWVKLPIAILLPYLGEYTSIIIHQSSINQLWLRVPSGSGFDPYIWTKVKASVGRWWYSNDSASGSYPQTNGYPKYSNQTSTIEIRIKFSMSLMAIYSDTILWEDSSFWHHGSHCHGPDSTLLPSRNH